MKLKNAQIPRSIYMNCSPTSQTYPSIF